jgi:uncharacterized protein DUF87
MKASPLDQRERFGLLVVDAAMLCLASFIAFHTPFPAADPSGFWFYTALFGLLLGSRLDTPFYAKPSDVVVYAAPAAVAIALVSTWSTWSIGIRIVYVIALSYCALSALLGIIAILTLPSRSARWQLTSNAARVLAETLGNPKQLYSVVFIFAVVAFHLTSLKEFGVLVAAWLGTGLLSPFEGLLKLVHRMRGILDPNRLVDADGDVIAYQTPGLMLIRQAPSGRARLGDVVGVHDPVGQSRVALALDHVGRDEGLLLRAIELPGATLSEALGRRVSRLPPHSAVRITEVSLLIEASPILKAKGALVGLVAPDTSINRLYFEVVAESGLGEGRLVEVTIGTRSVAYQIVNGVTKEEVVQQKNTRGFARAQAHKIGGWDAATGSFTPVKWLPAPNGPVYLKSSATFQPTVEAIGHFPGTDYPVSIKNVGELVTYNTAILGILGIGKSMLALELVERIITAGIKVICLDLTNQYMVELAPFIDTAKHDALVDELQRIGAAGKTQVRQNVEDGGSRATFSAAVAQKVRDFVDPTNPDRVMVINPAHFEVWKQDSKQYNNTASMASLSSAEIAHIVSHSALQAVTDLGMTDSARLCLVYEEAHSLVPEWNSAVADGDKAASNGCARAILQGRKYGLGCLLVAQRTANVTKTILNQCNTVFAMRTFDDTGKTFLASYIGDEYADSLSALTERHAVLFGKASSCENPILIRLNDRDRFIAAFRGSATSQVAAETPDEAL